jgi:hypothetical protein
MISRGNAVVQVLDKAGTHAGEASKRELEDVPPANHAIDNGGTIVDRM